MNVTTVFLDLKTYSCAPSSCGVVCAYKLPSSHHTEQRPDLITPLSNICLMVSSLSVANSLKATVSFALGSYM